MVMIRICMLGEDVGFFPDYVLAVFVCFSYVSNLFF